MLSMIRKDLDALREAGKLKSAPYIASAMGPVVRLDDGREVVNLSSNNYLGLADDPRVIESAARAMKVHGFGTASVRFICGSFELHRELEREISAFTGMAASTTYVSCWNANEALLPTLLGTDGAVISDRLNHASIIDSCRLCNKNVLRLVYEHSDMADLETQLKAAADRPRRIVITDGVFSMEGDIAKLPEIIRLSHKYGALVAVDDSHGHGVLGDKGGGVCEHYGVAADIVTGTLGKALGGAAGGFIAGPADVIEMLVQASRPQLFSNALPPAVAGGALEAIRILRNDPALVATLRSNVAYMRGALKSKGLEVLDSPSAILPIIIGPTAKALEMSRKLLTEGVLVTGFGYPVVPEGAARLRVQVSAAHKPQHMDAAVNAIARCVK
ncbi:MAG: glycine C-acetyltransferase [Planctomycetes bacterium]|nr:glycine C-acetyltransferase [Planctomycetota bacterium]